MCPRRLQGIEEQSLGDEMLVYCPELELGVSLNSSALAIWKLCDGQHTLVQISRELGCQLEISEPKLLEELLEDIESTVAQFNELGIVKIDSTA